MSESNGNNGKHDEPEFGGKGGVAVSRDVRLLNRALRQGWDIPEAAFSVLPNEMVKIAVGMDANREPLIDGNGKPISMRTRIGAARVVAMMHSQNQADNPAEQEVVHTVELSEPERIERVAGILNAARARRVGHSSSTNGNGTHSEKNGSGSEPA